MAISTYGICLSVWSSKNLHIYGDGEDYNERDCILVISRKDESKGSQISLRMHTKPHTIPEFIEHQSSVIFYNRATSSNLSLS
jgi:hypothetical protein